MLRCCNKVPDGKPALRRRLWRNNDNEVKPNAGQTKLVPDQPWIWAFLSHTEQNPDSCQLCGEVPTLDAVFKSRKRRIQFIVFTQGDLLEDLHFRNVHPKYQLLRHFTSRQTFSTSLWRWRGSQRIAIINVGTEFPENPSSNCWDKVWAEAQDTATSLKT